MLSHIAMLAQAAVPTGEVDMMGISQLISSVGFPITMTLILVYMIGKEQAAHKEEMGKINESLNNNTLAIQHLSDTLSQHINMINMRNDK